MTETPDEAERKQFLFWTVYIFDKSLSLRLGRSPTIQEYDITIPDPARIGPGLTPVRSFFALWVMASRLQGQIYEQLYSPQAVAQPDSVRQLRVQFLMDRFVEYDQLTHETTVRASANTSANWDGLTLRFRPFGRKSRGKRLATT